MIYAIVNNKGGVAKTTCAVNIAACLGQSGKKSLIIDLDPQGNASVHLGIPIYELELSIKDVMLGEVPIDDVVWETDFKNLDIAPSNLTLDEVEMGAAPGKEMALSVALKAMRSNYDFIFIDCPPRLGIFTNSALIACDRVIIPIQTEYFALEGTSQVLWAIDLVRKRFGKVDLEISHVIPTQFRKTRIQREIVSKIKNKFGDKTTEPVPQNIKIVEASANDQPIIYYDPKAAGAQAFRKLSKEIVKDAKA
jgi:chromosome partitioning protein